MKRLICFLSLALSSTVVHAAGRQGYYRHPTTDGRVIVFVAEGDLWRVPVTGGLAQRLTTHLGSERAPALSPDGAQIAFSAEYEGAFEVYLMPVGGGPPQRLTYDGTDAMVEGWTPDGKILYRTRRHSTLPDWQLATIDPGNRDQQVLPLAQAAQGTYDDTGQILFFTRLAFQGSSTKRYQGGTAQNLWRFGRGDREAVPLTADFAGTSKGALWWQGRVYFMSDRDGTMNLWSFEPDGRDLKQHTRHRGWDVQGAALGGGKIVYQKGADLRLFDLATGEDTSVEINLASDFDQLRERWVQEPFKYLTAAHLSPDGERVVLTARGQVFVAPVGFGRLVTVTRDASSRYRQARFLPTTDSLVALSDTSGELELWRLASDGLGEPEQLTRDGRIFRFDGVPSPDGKRVAYVDKNLELWVYDLEQQRAQRLAVSKNAPQIDLRWSPDSRLLAYAEAATNNYYRIWLHDFTTGKTTPLTSDRVNSYSPAWSPEGEYLYFISERHLVSVVRNPWGPRQPDPFLDAAAGLYVALLQKETRSPFAPPDELHPAKDEEKAGKDAKEKKEKEKEKEEKDKPPPAVTIDFDGLGERIVPLPLPPGNYDDLSVGAEHLYWLTSEAAMERKYDLVTAPIKAPGVHDKLEVTKVSGEIAEYELSGDRKKVLARTKKVIQVFAADGKAPEDIEKTSVDLGSWRFSFSPRDEWRQMFREAWRLERDYFYDRKLHGVDWPAMLAKYFPLVDRVTDRDELSDLLHQMVGELSALHIFVVGGDLRKGTEDIAPASLGAVWQRDPTAGGYRIVRLYGPDPDYPEELSPLAKPGANAGPGDIVERIDGVLTLSVPDAAALLRGKSGRQVRLSIRPAGTNRSRDIIVEPIDADAAKDLRYGDWEERRRLRVEERGGGNIGYVHLRAMGGGDYTAWARNFYPVFDRQGLIIDVRHNRGGNIDSWILGKLLRKAWFYWSAPVGEPTWSMQYAFRGHLVVLCDTHTASDGEAFAEGFRRLGLGKVIGTRTWGGEIWLSFDNWLVDNGIASAAEYGVYGPDGVWLIEGHGVDPDIVVDNLPHATFTGQDAQLDAAIEHLQRRIEAEPVPIPPVPPYPDKALN